MISQFQRHRVRVQVHLLLEVGLVVFAHVMVQQGDRHDQREILFAVLVQNLQKLLLFVGGELLLEVAHDVLQDVHIFAGGGLEPQGLDEQFFIPPVDVRDGISCLLPPVSP